MSYIGSRPANKAVTTTDIEDDAITSAKIATGTVVASDLGANSVDSSELVDGSVDISHLSASGTKSSSTFLAWSPNAIVPVLELPLPIVIPV